MCCAAFSLFRSLSCRLAELLTEVESLRSLIYRAAGKKFTFSLPILYYWQIVHLNLSFRSQQCKLKHFCLLVFSPYCLAMKTRTTIGFE